ncbi:hypothetical protein JCM6882_008077 [Rhodosporidiobolus microsporus]
MDFGDVVHKALASRNKAEQADGAAGADTDHHGTTPPQSKPRPPPLASLSVAGSTHATSSGASPAASRTASPARHPLPHSHTAHSSSTNTTAPSAQTPASPSRRSSSYNPLPRLNLNLSHRAHNLENILSSPTSPRSATSSPSQSRSPSARRPTATEEALFPPPALMSGPHIGRSGLGLDTPRPKHKSQASFDWFGDAVARESALSGGIPPYLVNGAGGAGPGGETGSGGSTPNRIRRTDSPARMDLSRSSSTSTSAGGIAALSSSANGKGKGRAAVDRNGRPKRGSSGDAPLTEESEWEDDARSPVSPPPNGTGSFPFATGSGSGSGGEGASSPSGGGRGLRTIGLSGAEPLSSLRENSGDSSPGGADTPPPTALRGAFTSSDLERGARRLRGEEPDSDGAKERAFDWKRRASALPSTFKVAKKVGGGGGAGVKKRGDSKNKLARTQSAGDAESPPSGLVSSTAAGDGTQSGAATPAAARARSIHAGEAVDAEWEDEVRDQFDANAPAASSPAGGKPGTASRRSSRWAPGGGGFFPHGYKESSSKPGSGTSTPRDRDGAMSEDEAVGALGGAATPRRPGAAQRRGSAWNVVREKLKGDKAKKKKEAQGASLTGHELISELATGVLPLVLVKMAVMDRDEQGEKRIPILLNYLKLRITDSVYPFHDKHAIFRIELEYGDSAVKWVIYRELKDFVNLHAHYRVANLRQGIDKFPTFPKTSLPYLNWLKSEKGGKGGVGKAEFAKAQREALENYLLKLIKATMFGPGANRLCKFLEISAMSIMLSTRGGEQGKQGYLRITSSGASRKKTPGFHPIEWKKRHEPKWFIVRDSYIVSVDDPASTEIYDVIMVDSTFEIERPTRVYRKGLQILNIDGSSSTEDLDAGLREGAVDLLANEMKPQGHRGARDPNDPSSSRHKPMGGMGGKGADNHEDPEKAAEKEREREGEGEGEGVSSPSVAQDKNRSARQRATSHLHDDPTAGAADENLKSSSNHVFYLRSSERKLRLVAKTERQQDQFIASIEKMLAKTIWAGRNRFDSFAPIRLNVAAQWLIDGRDYFWSLSRAIALAKHKIYIHDWWLSPELYLRRPAIDNQKWRLDRLLQRKAREGVQVFVIVYKEVSNDFTPVESAYTKSRLRGLHPNIHVQRSPSHTSTGTLLWSHHEKMCVIDETIGFMGGLDLCFGRWDTPGHVLIDDGPNLLNADDPQNIDRDQAQQSQIWPGKDYSNQRVLDFHTLSKPDEDMYDRGKVPRQPWHDIGLQIIGQPARDLCRHFIQRWNYLLRIKNHTVKMPFLLPAPDFTPQQLQEQRITGTCEVQICRSVGPWSMGISHIEHSIQNAYIKAIQLSDHFVYIENQFFVTSTAVEGTIIENKIGDALVSRIVRAHSEGTAWRAIIIVPTVPGYPYPLDHSEASSVRLIMECQYASICRGEHSIFARLRREGIDPDEYIAFFGLRAWGKLSSGALTTESTYIHAKGMVVDDRIAIIGSANINERSQRGDRDSELACIIRDTDMIDSTMGGKPYQVGRFAHTMRVRLMREHLGIDVDELEAAEGRSEVEAREATDLKGKKDEWDPDHQQTQGTGTGAVAGKTFHWAESAAGTAKSYAGHVVRGSTEATQMGLEKGAHKVKRTLNIQIDEAENKPSEAIDTEEETNADKIVKGEKATDGFASTVVPTLEEKMMAEHRPPPESIEEGGIRQLRHNATEEREAEPKTMPSSEARDANEQANDPARANGPTTDGHGMPAKSSEEDQAKDKKLGHKVTQTSELDDTRKLGMQPPPQERKVSSEHSAPPLSPIDEDGAPPKDGRPITPAPPRDDAAPPDIAKSSGQRNRSDSSATSHGHGKHASSASSSTPLQRTSSQSRGNEQAVNRNNITSSLRKNLRERGAYTIPLAAPKIDPYGFTDPLVDSFYKDVWLAAAVRNTQIYRKVFRCMPDDLVQTWKQYREFQNWAERHNKAPKDVVPSGDEAPHSDPPGHSGQHGAGGGGSAGGVVGQGGDEPGGQTMEKENRHKHIASATAPGTNPADVPGAKEARDYTQRAVDFANDHVLGGERGEKREGSASASAAAAANGNGHGHGAVSGEEELERSHQRGSTITRRARGSTLAGMEEAPFAGAGAGGATGGGAGAGAGGTEKEKKGGRGRSATVGGGGRGGDGKDEAGGKGGEGDLDESFPKEEREQMEQLLEEVTGQLVVFPTRFLEAESAGGNFLFSKDRIPPMAIYD